MKTMAISSFFVLFALAVGITSPAAFADHSEVTIETAIGSVSPGCEETPEGCYIPSTATVDVGGKVIFSNTDSAAHTFTSGVITDTESVGDVFDSGLAGPGSSYEWMPTEIGDQPYFCIVHPWMTGMIIVQEVGAEMEEGHGMENGDDHGTMNGGEMMGGMKDVASATGMLSDETMVSIWSAVPTEGEPLKIEIEFKDSEHVNYDIKAMQNGEEILNDEDVHDHMGKGTHLTGLLTSSEPVDITVIFQGYGVDDPKTGPIGEEVTFANIVPEFGAIAMMVLAVAIISIVAVTARSRVIPRF